MAHRPLPFEPLKTGFHEDPKQLSREVARFLCHVCEAKGDLPLVRSTVGYNPEATIKRAEKEGWIVKGAKARCPRCARAREHARGDRPDAKPMPTIVIPPKEPAAVMPAPTTSNVTPIANRPRPDAPTPDERLAIRALIEKHFDEGLGRYLNGYSDARVASEVSVPRKWVEDLREVAYGPLRSPPELDAVPPALTELIAVVNTAREIAKTLLGAADDAERKVRDARKALGLPT